MKRFSKQTAEQEYKKYQEQFVEKDLDKIVNNSHILNSKFINHGKLQQFINAEFKSLMQL